MIKKIKDLQYHLIAGGKTSGNSLDLAANLA